MVWPLLKCLWERTAADLFEMDCTQYILVVDYYSRYPEVVQLHATTSAAIVNALKSIFGRHGIPSTLVTDNGPQFNCSTFRQFSSQYRFHHITSSPRYPQSNGLVERAVRTVKGLLKGSTDPHLALLSYRATALTWCSLSPAELLFGCKIATNLPQLSSQLTPHWPYLKSLKISDETFKRKLQMYYNRRHWVRTLPILNMTTPVWVWTRKRQVPGIVISRTQMPRYYTVQTSPGEVRRNCCHLAPRLGEKLYRLMMEYMSRLRWLSQENQQVREHPILENKGQYLGPLFRFACKLEQWWDLQDISPEEGRCYVSWTH